ncbi:hypothetical protein [Psychroserpens luteus]|uniref:Glutaminyl-tRNA synthetase n=1 Tax=Psychroserpens luteus TaxID=1434066 RepID=A0ABW5ZU13_9FLAO|nr:hypothetical protein [Psychroserpens luteus]
MKNYKTFDDIDFNLKRLSLERQIALEELKGVKGEIKNDLAPYHWMQTVVKYATKFSSFMILKKIIK